MNVKYVDAHCHLQFDDYNADSEALISRMHETGVAGIVVGCDLETSRKAVALAEKYEHLYAAVGLHPNNIVAEGYDISHYRALATHPKVIAIGECGLDYYRPTDVNEEVKRKQKEVLQKHIELAALLDKPLILHPRPSKGTMDAYTDLIEILKVAKVSYPNLRGDAHFFVGGITEARALIALGFTVSFTAVITFARDYDEVIRAVPLESILSETDAPYVAPAPRRGKRNDPLAVIDVVAKIAEIRREDPEMVRETILANTKKMFAFGKISC